MSKSYLETSDINSQPQDYVVSNGQKYRVNRSPRVPIDSRHPGCESTHSVNSDLDDNQNDVNILKEALENADMIIARQNNEIRRQSQQIQKLEAALASALIKIKNRVESG